MEMEVAAPGDEFRAGTLEVPATLPSFGEQDTLIAAFRLRGIFEHGENLGDGIPATLILIVDLWRDRSGWWDSLVRDQVFTYRFQHDLWTNQYQVWNVDQTVTTLPDKESVRAYLERVHEVALGLGRHFDRDHTYYVTVKAILKPMDLDELSKMDAWLSGKVSDRGGGGVLGLPKALAQVVVEMTGLGDQSVVGRSRSFGTRENR
jgi:hypothetical protein